MKPFNYHCHATFSDGKNTAEEMVLAALDLGMTHLGFTTHSYTDFDTSYCIPKERIGEYRSEITQLKEKYRDKITVYCGIEQDAESSLPGHEYDYILSSVHELIYHGEFYPLDSSEALHRNAVETLFGGNYLDLAKRDFYLLTEKKSKIAAKNRNLPIQIFPAFNLINLLFSISFSRPADIPYRAPEAPARHNIDTQSAYLSPGGAGGNMPPFVRSDPGPPRSYPIQTGIPLPYPGENHKKED